jgi:CelD/BcsL family acetyltransferase involved in cellulose biosynthesis
VRADIIALRDLGPDELARWQQLATHALVPNAFFEPGFVLPAARGLGVSDVAVIAVRDAAGAWIAALPVRRVRRSRKIPGRTLEAWVNIYCFLGTPLVAGPDPEPAVAELLACVARERASLVLDRVDAEGPIGGLLSEAPRAVVLRDLERAALYRRPTPDYVEQTTSPRHRKEMRRTFRLLSEQVGTLSVQDRAGDPAAYEQFLGLEASGWKGRSGTAMASHPAHAEFFRELCRRFAADGRLELLALGSEDRIVAMKCNLVAGDVTFCFKIAHDETLGKYSPGIHLEVTNIEHFHASGSAWSDSCAASDNAMINRLWPQRRKLRNLVVCPDGPSGALAFAKWRAAAGALGARRELLTRMERNASED